MSMNRREILASATLAATVAVGTNVSAKSRKHRGTRTLIKNGFLYTADKNNTVLPECWILIEGDKIHSIGMAKDKKPKHDHVINARGKMILPGFVNPHWHESFVEGPDRAAPDDSDLELMPFSHGGNIEALGSYFGVIADVGEKFTPEEAYAIARWSLWTQLRSGTTAIGDIGSLNSTDAMAQAAIDLGMRIRVSRWGSDIMIPNGASKYKIIADVDKQTRDWDNLMVKWDNHASGLVGGMPSILACFGSSDAQLIGLRDVAKQYNSPYAAHLAPLKNEAPALQRVFGRSAIGRFDHLGMLTDRLLAVHTAYATPAEYKRIVETKVNICHSPANYGLLGETTISETGMIGRLIMEGHPVSCSTDGNISYTGGMPEAMRYTHLGHNEALNDNTVCPPTTALLTGTRNGALALGWEDKIGSITPGKQADIVLIDIDDWRYRLISHPLSVFLTAGGSRDVDTVIIAGKTLIKGGKSTTHSESQMLRAYTIAVETARTRIFGE